MRRSRWWLSLLLRLVPEDFRERRSGEIRDFVDEELATSAGRRPVVALKIVVDLLSTAVRLRLRSVGRALVTPGLLTDVRQALRSILRQRSFSLTVVLTLGVGIGATVALFTLVERVLLAPLPYPDADRLVRLWEVNPTSGEARTGPSPLNFVDWERQADGFGSMTAWYLTSATYRGSFGAEEVRSAQVTPGFFEVLGVPPVAGRTFGPAEETGSTSVVLSHRAWTRLFQADVAAVGTTVEIAGEAREIVGVMPPGFAFPDESVEAWISWDLEAAYAGRPETRTWRFMHGLGRMADDADLEGVESGLRRVAASLASTHPTENQGWSVAITRLHDEVVGEARSTLWVAFGAAAFVLLIGCANAGNLMLARIPDVARDVSLRIALGATRGAIARRLLLESLILAGLAAGLGLLIGAAMLEGLVRLDAGRIPRLSEVALDGGALAFAAAAAGFTALAFGLAPTLQALREATHGSIRSGTRATGGAGQRRIRELFVGAQLTIAVVLVAGAQLFGTSLRELTRADLGFDAENVVTFRVSLDPGGVGSEGIVAYYDGLRAALLSVPGVRAAGFAQTLPINPVGNDFRRPFRPVGSGISAADAPSAQMRIVSPEYPEAMGMRFVDGGPLPAAAALGEPLVTLVNETLARRLWPEGGAVGRGVEIDFRDGWQRYEIVGVVEDVRHYGPRDAAVPEVFLSHRQSPYLAMSAVVRTDPDREGLAPALRRAVAAVPPSQPAYALVTMEELSTTATADERFLAALMAVSSAIALILAITGIYGVIAHTVSHQRRSIGIRIALGAGPRGVVRTVLGRALRTAGAGIVVGLLLVLAGGPVVEGLLYGVEARNGTTTATVVALMLAVSALAAYLPARRAALIAPSEALQAD